ncbi:hypothetical protein CPB86DRAFT_61548 [Serendipita vermifera]|nr:hypothetical protein CPB86DRAFT_61548 [Serendipita vermifera]
MSLQNGYQIPSQTTMTSQSQKSIQNMQNTLQRQQQQQQQPPPPPSSAPTISMPLTSLVSPLSNHAHISPLIVGQTGPMVGHPVSHANGHPIGVAQASQQRQVTSAPSVSTSQVDNTVDQAPIKRGPGRPKGSTNKNKPPLLNPDGTPIPKRPVGRPKKEVDPNAPVKPKNPVGRPRKHPLPGNATPNPPMVVRPPSSQVSNTPTNNSNNNNTIIGNDLQQPNGPDMMSGPGAAVGYGMQQQPPQQPQPPQHQQPHQQMPGSSVPGVPSSSRLAPSPRMAPSPPVQTNRWDAGMMPMFRPSSNGPQRSTQPTPVPTLGHNGPSNAHFQSPTIHHVFEPMMESDLPNSGINSPLLNHRNSLNSRRASSPSSATHYLPPNHRAGPLHPPNTIPPSATQTNPPRTTSGAPAQVQQPAPTTRQINMNWEVLESVMWKEIQRMNFVNPHVLLGAAKSRQVDAEALRRSVPTSVLLAYHDHLRELRRETPARCPDTYTILNSFWLPGISPYFQLTTSRSSYSSSLSNHRFFFWDPMYLLVGGIHCPNCSTSLSRDGFHGPCQVIDINEPFYLIGQIYKCANCSKRPDPSGGLYISWDESILKALPETLAREFPAHVKQWGAFSRPLHDLVRATARAGVDSKALAEMIRAICKIPPPPTPEELAAMPQPLASPITAPSSPEVRPFTDRDFDSQSTSYLTANEYTIEPTTEMEDYRIC